MIDSRLIEAIRSARITADTVVLIAWDEHHAGGCQVDLVYLSQTEATDRYFGFSYPKEDYYRDAIKQALIEADREQGLTHQPGCRRIAFNCAGDGRYWPYSVPAIEAVSRQPLAAAGAKTPWFQIRLPHRSGPFLLIEIEAAYSRLNVFQSESFEIAGYQVHSLPSNLTSHLIPTMKMREIYEAGPGKGSTWRRLHRHLRDEVNPLLPDPIAFPKEIEEAGQLATVNLSAEEFTTALERVLVIRESDPTASLTFRSPRTSDAWLEKRSLLTAEDMLVHAPENAKASIIAVSAAFQPFGRAPGDDWKRGFMFASDMLNDKVTTTVKRPNATGHDKIVAVRAFNHWLQEATIDNDMKTEIRTAITA